jgi:PhnB protein
MPQPIPYLSFNGNCRQAMQFYEKALDATLEALVTNGDAPMAEACPPEARDKIMHACLNFKDGGALYAGDCPPRMAFEATKGIAITMNYPTVAEATHRFNALADGGTVQMPLAPMFWAKIFGMVTDRFGTPWIINGDSIPV